jgi:hypothetical protein
MCGVIVQRRPTGVNSHPAAFVVNQRARARCGTIDDILSTSQFGSQVRVRYTMKLVAIGTAYCLVYRFLFAPPLLGGAIVPN